MTIHKALLRFALQFAVVYVVLILPWNRLENLYGDLYREVAQNLFVRFGPHGEVIFLPIGIDPAASKAHDTRVTLINRKPGGRAKALVQFRITTRQSGFVPSVILIALVMATPIPWQRRVRALAIGLVIANFFALMALGLFLVTWFSQFEAIAQFHLSGPTTWLVVSLYKILSVSDTWHVLAVVTWMLVALTGKNREIIVDLFGPSVIPTAGVSAGSPRLNYVRKVSTPRT